MGCMVVRNMWFCMDLLTGWSSLISMPASIHNLSIATSLNGWSILLEYLQHRPTLQLMQCNESNILKRREHFEKPRQFQDFYPTKNQRFNEILHYNKINTELYYSDRCIHCFTETFITPADQFLGLQLKKNKAIKCKKLMFKKWIYIQINAKKETR